MNAQSPSLDRIVEALNGIIAEVAAARLHETVELLKIARLDLIMRANGFSEGELEALLSAIRDGQEVPNDETPLNPLKQTSVAGHC